MRNFLVALAAGLAGIADFWNGIATQISGMGALGDFLSVGYYGLSTTFSNLAQLCLDGAVAATELQVQVDAIRTDLGEALIESALGEAITSIWPEFPAFVADPGQWAIDILSDVSPELAAFLIDPEAWVIDILERWLPIESTPGGFEAFSYEGTTYYGNENTSVGQGFSFTLPPGEWDRVGGQFYALGTPEQRALLTVYRGATPHHDLAPTDDIPQGSRYGLGIVPPQEHLVVGITWRVLTRESGSIAFGSRVYVRHYPDPALSQWVDVELIGGTGPATWTLDWSGFITWLEGAFMSIAEGLYALLERILRYFWEGVY